MWLLGLGRAQSSEEACLTAEQEADAADVLSRLCKDRTAVTAALVELPCVERAASAGQRARALLRRVDGAQLTERDVSWMQALRYCLKERDASESQELARLMAEKRQWDFLARRFDKLHVRDLLEELEIDALEEVFLASKKESDCGEDEEKDASAPAKRRRLGLPWMLSVPGHRVVQPTSAESTGPRRAILVGEVLARKLATAEDGGEHVAAKRLRLRDLLVELYELSQDTRYVTKLGKLMHKGHEDLCIEAWARRVDLAVLQVLLHGCSASEPDSSSDEEGYDLLGRALDADASSLRAAVASMLAILGERHKLSGDLQGAADALHCALEMNPDHASARSTLLDVMLTQHAQHSEASSPSELLELLAGEAQWQRLVELYDSLEEVMANTIPTWGRERLECLAEALQAGGRRVESALAHSCLASCHEQAGLGELAFVHYRKAFALDSKNEQAEASMCRLALTAGRVQDAATELLLSQANGSEPERAASRIKEAVQLMFAYAERLAEDVKRNAESSISKQTTELADTESGTSTTWERSQEECSIGLNARPPLLLPSSLQHTPSPDRQPKRSSGEAKKLRETYPDRVPVVCRPATLPGKSGAMPLLKKMQFLVPEQMTCGDVKKLIQRKVAVDAACQDFKPQGTPLDADVSFGELYRSAAMEDGCVHLTYSVERTPDGDLCVELFPPDSSHAC
eukprot:TRINITY_DN65495_c0_g1_i1.p1 TRINITY_DN65495_c0_g1~~TRINITY_DN65495_c0_g1_i1.p1  ORF type:complete len:713 (+),score=164.11 TRINITY_DN65495_c0_g1_i1:72-2141(+)